MMRSWPIVRTTGSRGARNRIERIVRKSSKRLVVALREPLDKTFREDDFIENASWYANVSIHDCYFGRANRARGILLTTPGKVVVHNNRFMTAGTAILIEGDTDYWFESGAVCDMDIHDNLFENCGTSASNNGGIRLGRSPHQHHSLFPSGRRKQPGLSSQYPDPQQPHSHL